MILKIYAVSCVQTVAEITGLLWENNFIITLSFCFYRTQLCWTS